MSKFLSPKLFLTFSTTDFASESHMGGWGENPSKPKIKKKDIFS